MESGDTSTVWSLAEARSPARQTAPFPPSAPSEPPLRRRPDRGVLTPPGQVLSVEGEQLVCRLAAGGPPRRVPVAAAWPAEPPSAGGVEDMVKLAYLHEARAAPRGPPASALTLVPPTYTAGRSGQLVVSLLHPGDIHVHGRKCAPAASACRRGATAQPFTLPSPHPPPPPQF